VAIADVAVEMGPRNTRRAIAAATFVAAVALLVGGGALVTHLSSRSGSGTATPRVLRLNVDRLSYGMTKQQVQRSIGRPERIAGNCWQYPEKVKDFVGNTINAARVCFAFGNVYSNQYYLELNGKWREPGNAKKVIAPPTS